jgi:hypothetical protein
MKRDEDVEEVDEEDGQEEERTGEGGTGHLRLL